MKRPFVAVACGYAGGLLLADFFQPPLAGLFATAGLVLLAAVVCGKLRPVLIWPLLALAGWTNLVLHTALISPNDLRSIVGDATMIVTVRGTLAETPGLRIYERDGEQTEHTLASIHVSEVRRDNQWQPGSGTTIVTAPGTLEGKFFAGQPVEISGVICPPPEPVAEGLFDYRAYLKRQAVYYQLKTASAADWKLLSTNTSPPLSERFLAWSQTTLARGLPEADEPLRLLWAMTLGWKTALTGEVTAPFMQSGTIIADWFQIMDC